MASIDATAKIIWDYMQLHQPLKRCDAVFILCSRDDRVADYGAKLFLDGYGEWLIISGGSAHHNDLLQTSWPEATEAEHFAAIAEAAGVPRQRMILEDQATNTGENIRFTHALLQQKSLSLKSFLLVQKPYMERRTYATFMKQWPDAGVEICVTSPPIAYDHYFDGHSAKHDIINIMVGDLQRIKEYPSHGFQIEQQIPDDVWRAFERLVAAGYTKHLVNA